MASSSIDQASNPLECDICCNTYNDDHCPRILNCSHDFCTPCIEGIIVTQKKECPLCRSKFSNESAEDFMINRGLLDAAKQLSPMLAVLSTEETRPKQPFLKATQVFRKNFAKRGIAVCQGAEAEVQGLIDHYREMERGVQEVKLSSEKTLSSIDRSIKLLLNRLEKLQKNRTKLNESDAQLEAATGFISAAPLMQEAEELLQAMEETMAKFQEDKKEECHIKKEILKMKENLERFSKDAGRIITEEGEQEEERDSVVKITVESLIPGGGSPSPSPPLPSPPLPSLLPRGFLDLAYGPTPLGRVIIRVTVDGLKGRNFLQMCAGRMGGPSYVHSRVSYVVWKGRRGECIAMGKYVSHERGGGGGGSTLSTRAVLPSREEDWDRERENETYESTQMMAGEVRGSIAYKFASEFKIITRSDRPEYKPRNCFGMVEEGLDVLRAAFWKYEEKDIKENVYISQCGLIL